MTKDNDPTQWIKASASGDAGNCVEMRQIDGVVEVRDTKAHGEGPSLGLRLDTAALWLRAAKNGDFDRLL